MGSQPEAAQRQDNPVEATPIDPPPAACELTESPLANLAFCYRCGNPMTQEFCERCGHRRCASCGE